MNAELQVIADTLKDFPRTAKAMLELSQVVLQWDTRYSPMKCYRATLQVLSKAMVEQELAHQKERELLQTLRTRLLAGIPCGRVMGHGDSCAGPGWECLACQTRRAVADELAKMING